jgi:hypothetical protein
VNQQDQQAIDALFQHLYQATTQAGPRDSAAEALIQRYVRQAPPGLLYQMAQTLVAQQHTVNQLRAQLAAQRQNGAPAGFAPPQPGYQQGRQGGGFLAGAGQLALGIGGGILGAEVLTSIFDGAGNLFDGDRDREYDDGYRDGFSAGDDYRDQGNYQDQGDYQGQGPDDSGAFDNGFADDGFDSNGDDGGFF